MLVSLVRRLKSLPGIASGYQHLVEHAIMQMRGTKLHAEARFLLALVQSLGDDRPIVEIGTLFGFSTAILALGKKDTQSLLTVDNFCWNPLGLSPAGHERITRHRLRELTATGKVQVVSASKKTFFASYALGPPSLVFLDADHSYGATHEDIVWAKSVGATVICGHDYTPGAHDGVVKAVDEHGGPASLCESLFVLSQPALPTGLL